MKKFAWLAVIVICIIGFAAVLIGCGEETTTTTAAPTTTAPAGGETTTTAAEATTTTVGEKIVLKYAHFTSGKDFPGRQLDFWAEEINKRTNGQVEVQKSWRHAADPEEHV